MLHLVKAKAVLKKRLSFWLLRLLTYYYHYKIRPACQPFSPSGRADLAQLGELESTHDDEAGCLLLYYLGGGS